MNYATVQPPSGGCVLKQRTKARHRHLENAATFGWLCVETPTCFATTRSVSAATFGWLCVETCWWRKLC